MSADLLREAAALMRKRAEAASRGAWVAWPADEEDEYGPGLYPGGWVGIGGMFVAATSHTEDGPHDAEHIASWQPTVALAVADWLDLEARVQQRAQDQYPGTGFATSEQALAVARAYLGRDA